MQAVAIECTGPRCLAAHYAALCQHSSLSLQIPAGGVTKFLETAEEDYGAATAALHTQLLEADRHKQAAQEHARDAYEQRRRSCLQLHTARLLAADSEQAEKIETAQRVYREVAVAIIIERAKALQAWKKAQSLVGERRAEQEQVLSRQDELVRHLTALLNADEAAQRVCTCQGSSCILIAISNVEVHIELQTVRFLSQAANSVLFASYL